MHLRKSASSWTRGNDGHDLPDAGSLELWMLDGFKPPLQMVVILDRRWFVDCSGFANGFAFSSHGFPIYLKLHGTSWYPIPSVFHPFSF